MDEERIKETIAKWIKPVPGDGEPYCSNCKSEQIVYYTLANAWPVETPYCPWCGAKMENYGEKIKNHR